MAIPNTPVDPWLDEYTFIQGDNSAFFEELPKVAEDEGILLQTDPEPIPVEELVQEAPPAPPAPVAEVPPVPEQEPEPTVQQFKDGSTLTVEKKKGQWRAELSTNIPGVQPEVFYGKTKDELYSRIAEGKVNATRKIRELDRKVKLGVDDVATVPNKVNAPKKITVRALTPDEIFQYKTLAESDPVAALDFYNEKRYGLAPQEFAQRLNEPVITRQLAEIESVARTFVQTNPDYFQTDQNLGTIVRYLVKKYLHRQIQPDEDFDQLTTDMLERGIWTVDHLEQAKEDLTAGGFLESAPKPQVRNEPPPEPQPVAVVPPPPPAPVPPAPPAPIEQPAVTRKNFGIRPSGSGRPNVPQVVSDEDVNFNNMTDEDIQALLVRTRLERQKNRR